MCGIAGYVESAGRPVDRATVARMTAALEHRGPDGSGVWVDGPVGLGHRRLAIIDLTDAAAQPMHADDGGAVLAYNGEIYNFRALREEYESRGYRFRSHSDTEVVLAAYRLDGIASVERFNGMFAFVLWDRGRNRLHMVRDRFGIKPLYYAWWGESLAFASEIAPLLRHPAARMDLNLEALNEYFTFQTLLGQHTLFSGVSSMRPGTILTLGLVGPGRQLEERTYWAFDFQHPDSTMDADDAALETRRLFEAAVHRQLVSDVPVGSYLSGGMDSGSITSLAARAIPGLSTFTCGFDTRSVDGVEAAYDERSPARVMAQHYGTDHHERVLGPQALRDALTDVTTHLEDLRVGMSYPNYYAAQLAAENVVVCLSGAGGDELFGGYPWRYRAPVQADGREAFLSTYYAYWERLVRQEEKAELFQPAVFKQLNVAAPRRAFRSAFDEHALDTPESRFAATLWFDASVFLHGLLLVGDRLAMAWSLEERVPFLDNEMVGFAQRVPAHLKVAGIETWNEHAPERAGYVKTSAGKQILRDAMCDLLPAEIRTRRKQGFSPPEAEWYRGPNLSYLEDRLLGPSASSAAFIRPEFVQDVVRRHVGGENHRLQLWSLLSFEEWCRHFLD